MTVVYSIRDEAIRLFLFGEYAMGKETHIKTLKQCIVSCRCLTPFLSPKFADYVDLRTNG